ncbi:MAG: EVE domain-containing protein [Gemmatimonadales bacterium]
MPHWLLKTEPSTYSFPQLVKDRTTTWDGVAAPAALLHLRGMAKGDEVLIYHSGEEKAIVGRATVIRAAYPDPKQKDPRFVAVDLKAGPAIPTPVTLATIKADPAFKSFALVRISRLSVMPVSAVEWKRLLQMGGA